MMERNHVIKSNNNKDVTILQSGKCRDPGCMLHIRIRDTLGSETLPDPGNPGTEMGRN